MPVRAAPGFPSSLVLTPRSAFSSHLHFSFSAFQRLPPAMPVRAAPGFPSSLVLTPRSAFSSDVSAFSSDVSAFSSDYIYALKDINFEVKQGEVLGIIDRNAGH